MSYVTYADIAKEFNLHQPNIYTWINKYGLKMPDPINPGKRPLLFPDSVIPMIREFRAGLQKPKKERKWAPCPKRPQGSYTSQQLREMFGLTPSQFVSAIRNGWVSRPEGCKKNAYYTEEHVAQLEIFGEHKRLLQSKPNISPSSSRLNFSRQTREQVWDKSSGVCHYCHRSLNPFRDFSIDHIVPVAHGGTDDIANLVAACRTCNVRKHTKPYEVFKSLSPTLTTIRN